jgi:hypothetical protein
LSNHTSLEKRWAGFVLDLMQREPEAYVQIRKIFRDISWSVPFDEWDGISLKTENMGYAEGDNKMRQLLRNYHNADELTRAAESLSERIASGKQQSSITARFGNGAKDSRSQGFCMQTLTLSHILNPLDKGNGFVIELYYRSTEVGQKFLADLMYLDQVVLPLLMSLLPVRPREIRFKFSTLYLSSMFMPIVLQILPVVDALKLTKENDPKWFSRCLRVAVEKWMVEECGYGYRTRAKMHHTFRSYVVPRMSAAQQRTVKTMVKK